MGITPGYCPEWLSIKDNFEGLGCKARVCNVVGDHGGSGPSQAASISMQSQAAWRKAATTRVWGLQSLGKDACLSYLLAAQSPVNTASGRLLLPDALPLRE